MTSTSAQPTPSLDRVHMVGIGGAGMSGIAQILLDRGVTVTGSDMKDSRTLLALRTSGATIHVGHDADNLASGEDAPTVVVTSFAAIPDTNPELRAAKERGIPLLRRSDVLALLMEDHRAFLMAGTHGKTSTTSMAVAAIVGAGLDPSFAIGGQLNRAGTNAHHGSGDIFVAEADESDGSFVSYTPTVAVITNIEPDHLDYFGSAEAYDQAFIDFADRVLPGGSLVLCLDDAGTARIAERLLDDPAYASGERHLVGYGTRAAVDAHPGVASGAIRVGAIVESAEATTQGTHARVRIGSPDLSATDASAPVHDMHVATPGMHMVLNASAALVGGIELGVDRDVLLRGIEDFDGVRRRFESYGEVHGVSIYDDYAHHPTEVEAVLTAARERQQARGGGRVIAIFQPHLYSRTQAFAAEFGAALSLADEVILMDIFGAREEPIWGVESTLIGEHITSSWRLQPNFSAVTDDVLALVEPGDMVLTIGAGTVTMLAADIRRALDDAESIGAERS